MMTLTVMTDLLRRTVEEKKEGFTQRLQRCRSTIAAGPTISVRQHAVSYAARACAEQEIVHVQHHKNVQPLIGERGDGYAQYERAQSLNAKWRRARTTTTACAVAPVRGVCKSDRLLHEAWTTAWRAHARAKRSKRRCICLGSAPTRH